MTIPEIVQTGLKMEGWSTHAKLQYMVELILQRRPITLVEVGIYGGRSFFPMYWASQQYAFSTLHGIDPYCNADSAVGQDSEGKEWWSKLDHNWIFGIFNEEFQKLNPKPIFHKNKSREVDIKKVDYLHIDGNHSEEESSADVDYWLPRMSKGGVSIPSAKCLNNSFIS